MSTKLLLGEESEAILEAEPGQDSSSLEAEALGSKALVRKAGSVGALTLLSRFFGFARDSVIAYVLGTQAAADAFYVAFRIPNLLRRLLAEGNLTLSFVPVFTQSLHHSKENARKLVDATFTLLLLVLTVTTILGVLGAAFFVHLTASGFVKDPAKFQLTVLLTRITFPYIFLVSLSALMMGILNARHRFIAPALAPVLLNIGIIAGALFLSGRFSNPAIGIAWGVLLGGVLQLAIQLPRLISEGFLPRLNINFSNPDLKKVLALMVPAAYGSAVYQINLLIMTQLASFLPTGSVSYLWYADRVIEFPLGIFAISLATVALPLLSGHAAKQNKELMKKTFLESLSMIALVNIPAAVGLAVLAKPVLALLFYRGGFSQESTLLTAQALRFFALGLPFAAGTRLVATAFYAVQEAKKPVLAANVAVAVNIALGLLLFHPMKHRGLALAIALGSIVNFCLIFYFYRQRSGSMGLGLFSKEMGKMIVAAGLMALTLITVGRYWDWSFSPTLPRACYLLAMLVLGISVYFVLVSLLRVESVRPLLKLLKKKLKA